MKAGDLAAISRRLENILDISTENRSLIAETGKSNSELVARLDVLEDSSRPLADSRRLQGESGP